MQTYDILMLVVLAATTIFGAIKGFAWQLASLASIVASYFVAYAFRGDVAKMINADPPWNVFLAMLLLYFGSSFVIWMVFRLVSTSIDKVRLREFDRHLGAGFGLLKGMILCLLITMFAMSLLGTSQQQRIASSKSGMYISRVLSNAGGILPAEIKQVVGPYLDDVGQKLQEGQRPGLQLPYSAEAGKLDSAVKELVNGVTNGANQAVDRFRQTSEQFGQLSEAAGKVNEILKEKIPNLGLPTSAQSQSQSPVYQQPSYLPPQDQYSQYQQPQSVQPQYSQPSSPYFGTQSSQTPILPSSSQQAPSGNYAAPIFIPNQPQQSSGGLGTY